jgi:hypothetical protein
MKRFAVGLSSNDPMTMASPLCCEPIHSPARNAGALRIGKKAASADNRCSIDKSPVLQPPNLAV